jgi:hypothetical protein
MHVARMKYRKDRYGHRWVTVGRLSVAFGQRAFIERVWWRGKMVYADKKAYYKGVLDMLQIQTNTKRWIDSLFAAHEQR